MMYTRQQSRTIKQQFFTTLGQYLKPIPSATDLPVHWLNYHTGVKDVFFRIITQPEQVSVALTFEQASPAMQRKFFSHLQQLKTIFTAHCGTHWVWHEQLTLSPNRQVAAVQTTLPGHNVLLQQQWPPIIAFCKKNLIALDAFWADTKEGFEWLQDNS